MGGELLLKTGLKLIQSAGKLLIRGQEPAQLDEGTHDVDPHLDRPRAVQDGGSHDRPVLGKRIGWEAWVAVPLGTGRKVRPVQCYDFI